MAIRWDAIQGCMRIIEAGYPARHAEHKAGLTHEETIYLAQLHLNSLKKAKGAIEELLSMADGGEIDHETALRIVDGHSRLSHGK